MLKSTRQRLFIDGYREVIRGSNLGITGCTTAMQDAFMEGKKAAREDIEARMSGPFNEDPKFIHLRLVK